MLPVAIPKHFNSAIGADKNGSLRSAPNKVDFVGIEAICLGVMLQLRLAALEGNA